MSIRCWREFAFPTRNSGPFVLSPSTPLRYAQGKLRTAKSKGEVSVLTIEDE
jgi:hypothetical protein